MKTSVALFNVTLILLSFTVIDCGDPGDVPNAIKSGRYVYNEQVTYTCRQGYRKVDGDFHLHCQADGTWSGTPPTCTSKFRWYPSVLPLKLQVKQLTVFITNQHSPVFDFYPLDFKNTKESQHGVVNVCCW